MSVSYTGFVLRRLQTIMVFLILGAIVTAMVAWGCARWADVQGGRGKEGDDSHWCAAVPAHWPLEPDWVVLDDGWGIEQVMSQAYGPQPADSNLNPTIHRLVTHRVGWPFHSMRWDLHGVMEDARGTLNWFPNESVIDNCWITGLSMNPPAHFDTDAVLFYRHWPLRPIAGGFAADAVFYAVLIWCGWTVPSMARRLIRRRRGRCERCAYPIGASPVCTECGAAVHSPGLGRGDSPS